MFRVYDYSVTAVQTLGRRPVLAPGRQEQRENAAFSGFGLDVQAAPVAVDDVLHNGEAEAGPAQLPRSCRVHPVEPFGQTRNVLLGDALALVGDAEGDHGLGRADALQLLAAGDGVVDPP